MWVNRMGAYPHVSRETWWTRYHLLGRKIERQSSIPTIHDRRVAGILRVAAARLPANAMLEQALKSMEWLHNAR